MKRKYTTGQVKSNYLEDTCPLCQEAFDRHIVKALFESDPEGTDDCVVESRTCHKCEYSFYY